MLRWLWRACPCRRCAARRDLRDHERGRRLRDAERELARLREQRLDDWARWREEQMVRDARSAAAEAKAVAAVVDRFEVGVPDLTVTHAVSFEVLFQMSSDDAAAFLAREVQTCGRFDLSPGAPPIQRHDDDERGCTVFSQRKRGRRLAIPALGGPAAALGVDRLEDPLSVPISQMRPLCTSEPRPVLK